MIHRCSENRRTRRPRREPPTMPGDGLEYGTEGGTPNLSQSTAAPTVFVIDDDAQVRAAIQGMLKSVGLQSETFASPQDFLCCKRPDGPSCLVLDMRLPGVSGLDFQRQLADAGVRIPIIFITGHGDIPMTLNARNSGAVEFRTKPFRDQDLLDAIHQGLDRNCALR